LEFVEDSKFPTAIPDGATLAKHPAAGKRLFQQRGVIEDGGWKMALAKMNPTKPGERIEESCRAKIEDGG